MVEAIYFVVLVSTFLYQLTLHYFPPIKSFQRIFSAEETIFINKDNLIYQTMHLHVSY